MPTRSECVQAGFLPSFGLSARQLKLLADCRAKFTGPGFTTAPGQFAPAPAAPPPSVPNNLPQSITFETDPCELVNRWMIAPQLAFRLKVMASKLPFGVSMISGFRTEASQDALRARGRPAAPNDRSTHLTCPATGADLRIDVVATNTVRARFGLAATESGLRWGGGSPVDPETGIPFDWNHVDLGPR